MVGLRGKGWVQHQARTEQERLAADLGSGQWADNGNGNLSFVTWKARPRATRLYRQAARQGRP